MEVPVTQRPNNQTAVLRKDPGSKGLATVLIIGLEPN